MAISFESMGKQVEDASQNYAVDRIVYVRGTKEGYLKVKPYYSNYLCSINVNNRIKALASGMMARYVAARNQALSQVSSLQIAFTEALLEDMQNRWVNALTEGLGVSSGNFSESTASTMRKVQLAFTTFEQNNDKAVVAEVDRLVAQLEVLYNSLSEKDKADLAGLIYDSHRIEGRIVNIENGTIVLSRLRGILERLKANLNKIRGNIRATNAEFGAINEVMDTYALTLATRIIENTMGKNFGSNIKVQLTGSRQTIDEAGHYGTGTTDAMFTYDADYNGSSLLFNFGISIKATGTIIDQLGKWVPKKGIARIKIKSLTAQYLVWSELLAAIGAKTPLALNSIANTLVWGSGRGLDYRVLTKSLLATFFEKYLTGGNKLAATTGLDIADAIMINGVPIPVMLIISGVINQLDSGTTTKTKSIAFVDLLRPSNTWIGSLNNLKDAVRRSNLVLQLLQRSLQATVYLNGNGLYLLASLYI